MDSRVFEGRRLYDMIYYLTGSRRLDHERAIANSSFLRKGIVVNAATIKTAVEIYLQGWRSCYSRKTIRRCGVILIGEQPGFTDIGIILLWGWAKFDGLL
jgi:hypothetical protein